MDAPDLLRLPEGLPVPADDGAASQLPGRAMPALGLPATDGRQVALDGLGGGRTVVYVYPMTGRPGADLPPGRIRYSVCPASPATTRPKP